MSDLAERAERAERRAGVLLGTFREVRKQVKRLRATCAALDAETASLKEAQAFLQERATDMQRELTFHLSRVISTAFSAVFARPYTAHIDLKMKRGRGAAKVTFTREGKKDAVNPMTDAGGGAVDIAAFALRLSLWSLKKNVSRSVFVFDEPFRFLSVDKQGRASEMLKQVCQEMGLQLIFVSHSAVLISEADNVLELPQPRKPHVDSIH